MNSAVWASEQLISSSIWTEPKEHKGVIIPQLKAFDNIKLFFQDQPGDTPGTAHYTEYSEWEDGYTGKFGIFFTFQLETELMDF